MLPPARGIVRDCGDVNLLPEGTVLLRRHLCDKRAQVDGVTTVRL